MRTIEVKGKQSGDVIIVSDEYRVREHLEVMLEEALGFPVSLEHREIEEEEDYIVYLHTDTEDDLTGEDLEKLTDAGLIIYDEEENVHNAICKYLNITVAIV